MIHDVIAWFRDSDHWHGASGVPTLLGQHALLTLVSMLIAMAIGLPIALWLGHRGHGGTFAVNLTNIGRAIPIVALLSLLSLGVFGTEALGPLGPSRQATLVTHAQFALPPIVKKP
jgi:osmoprotectant transport system permease protein